MIEDWFDPQPNSSIQPKARGLLYIECEFITHHINDDSKLEHLIASMQSKKFLEDCSKHSTDHRSPRIRLHTCSTRLRRAREFVRPGAARLLISVKYSRVRDNASHVPYPLVTTRLGVGLADIQENYLTILE